MYIFTMLHTTPLGDWGNENVVIILEWFFRSKATQTHRAALPRLS